jgi:succinoglycan biosynthesis transport protein ExoP
MGSNVPAVPSTIVRKEDYGRDASLDLMSVVRGVLGHWKLISTTLAFALIAIYSLLRVMPSYYKSTVEILVVDPQRQMDAAVQKPISPFIDTVTIEAMNTEIEVLKSRSLAFRVVRELGLDKDPEFQPHNQLSTFAEWIGLSQPNRFDGNAPGDSDKATTDRLDKVAGALVERIQVERVLLSYILSVSVTSQDAAKAQRLAGTVADDYLASQREARQEALQRVASWLKGRVDDLQSRVLETEASMEKLKAESGITDTGLNNIGDQQISEVNTQLIAARGEVAEKRAHLEQARRVIESNGDVRNIPELTASPVIGRLLQQQAELSSREVELRSKLGEGHSYVVALRAQLAAINKQVIAEANHVVGNLESIYNIAVRREQSLESSLQKLTGVRGNSEVFLKLQQLRRVADADRKLYENYLSQFNEISQRRTLQDASARIIAPATLPDAPSSPRRKMFYALAGIFGLVCGFLVAFLIEHLRSGLRTAAQVEQSFGYPVMGIVPVVEQRNFRRAGRIHTMTDSPLSGLSEAINAMRIGLELSDSECPPKVILITSSVPAEGKSAVAILLAASSANSGRRTVLVDCDLRQRSISGILGKNVPGLTEVLRGTVELAKVICPDPKTGIQVIPAGSMVLNPADLLMSSSMRGVLSQLRNQFDYIVIDSSPLLPVVDALGLSTIVDKILVVVEWSRTPEASVSQAFKVLRPEASRIAGVVLNKVDLKQLDPYGYAYGTSGLYPRPGENAPLSV